ncbi:MAG: hypothetical protein V7636_2310, partial [Actinomycetota bacterium]
TVQHAPFRALLAGRLRDAHSERGHGMTTTWPVGRHLPRFARLDHILVSPQLAVLDAGEFTVPGSDHRGITARLATS